MNSENNSPIGLNDNENKPKWLTRKIYETAAEKKRDFWLGVGLFFLLNILLVVCQWGFSAGVYAVSPSMVDSDFPSSPLFSILSWALLLLPWVINIGLIVFFALTRSQIALGMVAGFGIALAIVICLGLIFTVWCFATLASSS